MEENSGINPASKEIAATDMDTQHSIWTVRKILNLLPLFLGNFLMFAAYAVFVPFFPSEAREKGVSSTVIALIFGTYPFVIFAFSPVCGYFIPKYGPRCELLAGIFVLGGSLILFGFCGMISDPTVFTVLCFLLRVTSAMGGAACEISILSIILEEFPDNVAAATGCAEAFSGVGFSLGPVIGGFLYDIGGFRLPFMVMGSVVLANLPVLFILLKKKENKNEEESSEQSASIFKALRIPGIFMLALCYVVFGISMTYIEPILEPYLKKMGLSPTQIGSMFFVFSGAYAFSVPVMGWIGDKTECYRGMQLFGFTGLGVVYLFLGPATFLTFLPIRNVWLFYITLLVCGLCAAICFVPIIPDILRTARNNGLTDDSSRNAVSSSIFGSMVYLGSTIGPLIAGVCDQYFGFQWATSVAGFICFFLAMLLSVFTLYDYVFKTRSKSGSNFLEDEEKAEPTQQSLTEVNMKPGRCQLQFQEATARPQKPQKNQARFNIE